MRVPDGVRGSEGDSSTRSPDSISEKSTVTRSVSDDRSVSSCYMRTMSIDVLVLCRRSPSLEGRTCPAAKITQLPVRSVRANRVDDDFEPELAHKRATRVEIYAHELAGIVELSGRTGGYALTLAYAELIARAFDGVVVVHGDLVFEAGSEPPRDLDTAWAALDRRAASVLADPRRRHSGPRPDKDDWSSV